MHIIYISNICTKKVFNNLFENSKIPPGHQVQKYHRLLVEGFSKNNVNVTAVSALPITKENTKKIFIRLGKEKQENVIYNYLPIINLKLIRNLFIMIFSFFKTLHLCIKHKDAIIICDVLQISVAIGALFASKICAIPTIGIVTDLPSMLHKNGFIVKVNNFIISMFSSYIFLTEQMNDRINKKHHRPYLVIEGHVDINMQEFENKLDNKHPKKVCIYAGALNKIYGIEKLVKAFLMANIDNAELHIYGNGDYQDELKNVCLYYPNIKYFGVVPNDLVVSEELKATLLINPRPSNEEFTKYSFPSKNMEYMASGTPVLTTMLPGMPEEYKDYVYIIEDESIEGISESLKEILQKPIHELHEKGLSAKKFVIEKKNNVYQTSKIINKPKNEIPNYYVLAKNIFNKIQIYLILALIFFTFINFNHQGLKILYNFGLPLFLVSLIFNFNISKRYLLGLFLIIAFEITYHMIFKFHVQDNRISIFRGLPALIYSLGYFTLNDQNFHNNIVKAKYVILFVAFVLFLYGAINFATHFLIIKPQLAEDPGRLIYDVWGRDFLAATNQGSKFTLALGLLPLVFFTKENKILLKLLIIVVTIISITAMVFFGNRAGFVFLILNFILCTIMYYFLQFKNKIDFKKLLKQLLSIGFIFGAIILVLFIFYNFNLLNFKDILESTQLFSKVSPDLINDPRLTYWKIAFLGMFKYPMGGFLTPGLLEHYAHNLWLDTAYSTGVIPFTILLIISVFYLALCIKLFFNSKITDDFKIFILAISFPLFLNYMIEPIIEGYFYLFLCIFIIGGLLLKIYDKSKQLN